MKESYIIIRRYPYEEPDNIELRFYASNGSFSGEVDIYITPEEIIEIGSALRQFPSSINDEYLYTYGSEELANNFNRYFLLRAYTTNASGHCALQMCINSNRLTPEEGVCKFSIPAEAAAINRLGELLEHFGALEHLEIHWSPDEGALHKEYRM